MGLYPLLKRNIQNWIYGEDGVHSGSSGPCRPYTTNFLQQKRTKPQKIIARNFPSGSLQTPLVEYFVQLCKWDI